VDNRQDPSENPYAAPPVDADLAMANSPFGLDLSQDEQIRLENISHEASIRAIGFLYYLGAVFIGPIGFTNLSTFMVGIFRDISNKSVSVEGIFVYGFLCFVGFIPVLFFFTGRGLRRFQPWARMSSGILSALSLLSFPFGTLINVYFLYLLLSRKASVIFSPEYREIIGRTPHIKTKTALVEMILCCVLLTLQVIVMGMISAM